MQETIPLPQGVTAKLSDGNLALKGPKGEVSRQCNVPLLQINVQGTDIVLSAKDAKREKKLLFTYKAHIRNMCRGVTEGHVYKLRICAGHFPMNVTMKGNVIEIKNFIGEKVPRIATLSDKVSVKIDGKDIIVEGTDKELTAQAAASIEQLTRRVGFDRRIFQDGIYIIEKDGKQLM